MTDLTAEDEAAAMVAAARDDPARRLELAVAGYLDHRDLSRLEYPLERFFMDVAR